MPTVAAGSGNIDQTMQQSAVDVWHVASYNQIPRSCGYPQRRNYASQRSATRQVVRNNGHAEAGITTRVRDNGDVLSDSEQPLGDMFDESLVSDRQNRLIPTHPGTFASRENKPSYRDWQHARWRFHARMIASAIEETPVFQAATGKLHGALGLSLLNRMVYICFFLFWGIMASTGIRAANVAGPSHAATTVVKVDRQTGRLVRSMVVNSKVIPPKAVVANDLTRAQPVAGLDDLIQQAAKSYDLDPMLVHSMIQVESNYNPFAVSHKGAEGLMQLIPSTARRFGAKDSFNAKENIDAGARYLRYLKNIFGDDRLALAAYNAGEAAVARYGWIPPYPETQQYVYRVGKKYGEARRAAERRSSATAVPAAQPVEEHPILEQYRDEQGRLYLRTR